ncbi:histidine kinase [Telluria mixta]|uniref:Histidine kinase n=1 Tax=Telluria mixta TaxID=34071 RepID=A0ABT2C7A1_9BURK|nr:sensor histidine kinase [Telluria mixta]MCS0633278.1 histidine kinase [Telluria mixta]WEM94760.1 triple tyrosine motif-containing protein [Telluria mixta]
MRRRHRLVRALAAVLLLAAGPVPAAPETFADYHHTQWTAADGVPPGIAALAQTHDGWLWLGTADGLYRFDGLAFERVPLPSPPGRSRDRVSQLVAAPNGDLYLAHLAEGVSVLRRDGRFEDLPSQPPAFDGAGDMAVDTDGTLWTINGPVLHLVGGTWRVVAEGPDWNTSRRRSLVVDGAGQLWAFNDSGVWRLDRVTGRFIRVVDTPGKPLLAPDGRLWMRQPDDTLRLVDASGAGRPDTYAPAEGRTGGHFGADGTLWLLACPQTMCRVPNAGARKEARWSAGPAIAERIAGPAQVSGVDAAAILEDREGDIWIATENGLDRFRHNRFLKSGLPGSGLRYSLATDTDGRVWAADRDTGTLWRLAPDAAPVSERGPWTTVVANGPDGALLAGGKRRIQRRRGGAAEDIPLPPGPDGKQRDYELYGLLDDGKVLWTATNETGLIGWRDGKWLPRSAFNLPPKIYQSAPAGPGGFWMATGDGKLVLYDDGKLAVRDLGPVGTASALFAGAELVVSGTGGTAVLQQDGLRLLHTVEPGALRNLSGMIVTDDGDRWLNGVAGLVHVRAADWRQALQDPGKALRYELFNTLDGYPGRAVFENRSRGIVSADGRNLWLTATGGVVRLDLAQLRRNRVAPQAVILGVTADGRSWPAHGTAMLPAGTDHFRVQYTAPALRLPERVRFEYRLDGVDKTWLDAGTRRATSYTNIGPGDYVFRVRAVNEDGVPGDAVATLPLHVAPTLVQTLWFRLACAGALALLGVLLYRYRMRYVTRRLTERLQVRTAERERIARTLHDTFLQTVQGLVLRVDAVAATLPPDAGARRQLENVLDDASHAIGEGRDQLQELRAGDAHVLEDVLADAIARLGQTHGAPAVDVHVEGERRPLLAPVADEIAEIAREALRNAFAHAHAARIRVTLVYARRTLSLCVADDGRGLPESVRRDGTRSGHWGLVGMRERAERIGARLDIACGPRQGTTVTLAVPGAHAYGADRTTPI